MPVNQILKEEQGTKKVPAWAPKSGGGSPFKPGSVKSGVKFSWEDNEGYMNYMRPTTAEDISNPNVPLSAIMQDNSPAAVQARLRFGAPPVDRWETDPPTVPNAPAWFQPPAQPKTTAPAPISIWANPYHGNPVNESYSDTLRSMEPEDPAAPPVDRWETDPPTVPNAPYPLYAQPPAFYPSYYPNYQTGFGTRYSGNWGSGGGYGGGGYQDYGDRMGLFSWKFG